MLSGNKMLLSAAPFIFLLGALTDYFDGYLARKLDQTSEWGRFFDPLADKILTISAFLSFVFLDIMPLWVFIIILFRDLGTTFLRVYGNKKNITIKTSFTAKWKTFLQMSMICYILVLIFFLNCDCIKNSSKILNKYLFSDLTFWAFVLLALYSVYTLIEYLFITKRAKNEQY
jgi:CDP-diacylglycerol--glycerol-3-phosphate 3-phosphatidyltransferase